MKEIERVTAVAVAALSKRESDALKVRNGKLEFEVTRLHSVIDNVEQLHVEVTRLGRDVEKTTASLTNTANMRDAAVEEAGNLSAQLAASVCREDAYKSEITAVRE